MPQVVDNSLKLACPGPQAKRYGSANRNEPNDLFQKVLNGSRQKAREPSAEASKKATDTAAKSSAVPKRADCARRRQRPQDQIDPVEQQDENSTETTAVRDDASTSAPTSDETTTDKKPDKSATDDADAVATDDPAEQAIKASEQITAATQNIPSDTKANAKTDESDSAEPVNPLVALKAQADEKVKGAAEPDQAADNLSELGLPADPPADKPAGKDADASQNADAAAPEIGAAKEDTSKLKKVSPLGETIPQSDEESVKAKSSETKTKQADANDAVSAADVLAQLSDPGAAETTEDDSAPLKPADGTSSTDPTAALTPEQGSTKTSAPNQTQAPQAPPPPREVDFADNNHDRLVTSMKSALMPNGGTMHMRLDPPELGVLQVTVKMQNGVMTASFETSNSDATRLLSHSLGQLKTALESQGISVEKLHVQESPKDQQSSANDDGRQQSQQGDQSARQEQQRREMLRRMWRRLGIGHDPLDMVA